jgi:hypothetical protein
MTEDSVFVEAPEGGTGTPPAKRRRFSIPMIVAAVIMFLAMVSYFVNGVLLLLDLGVFSRGLGSVSLVSGSLTSDGRRLVLAAVYLFFGALALAILVGFLLRRRRAWSAAMTWTALSLAINLVGYFIGQPRYLGMLAGVVLLLVLNQASVHSEFQLEGR